MIALLWNIVAGPARQLECSDLLARAPTAEFRELPEVRDMGGVSCDGPGCLRNWRFGDQGPVIERLELNADWGHTSTPPSLFRRPVGTHVC